MTYACILTFTFCQALVIRQDITLRTLVACVAYLAGLFQSVQTLTGVYQTLRRASVSVECVLSLLDTQSALGDLPNAREPGRLSGEVEFRDVSFAYRAAAPV